MGRRTPEGKALVTGEIRLGPFELEEVIGRGGMGEVWRGRHAGHEVPVAIKVITGDAAREPSVQAEFRREVQIAARLAHPGIVTLFDYGQVPADAARASGGALAAGSPYLVMEWIERGSLRGMRHPVGWPLLRHILLGVLDSLAHAHARGVLHRDLKPDNILLGAGDLPRPILSDFGIARALDEPARTGSTEQASGTPFYMPPEQIRGHWRDYGPWTDLYALGCMTFELAAGRRAFQRPNVYAIICAHLLDPAPPLPADLGLPANLSRWVARLLRKAPHERFCTAADAARALLELAPPPGVSSVTEPGSDLGRLEATTCLDPSHTLAELHPPLDHAERPPPATPISPDRRAGSRRPALPASWRPPPVPASAIRLVGVGLGLYDLRSVPLVNRDEDRDAIWRALGLVVQSGGPRALILRGVAGVGKSRLVEWMSERAVELGAAQLLRATHGERPGPGEGLGGMFARVLRCVGLERAAVLARVRTWLGYRGVDDEHLALAVTDEIAPAAPPPERRTPLGRPAERWPLLGRLLAILALERPVILWLDDVHWGGGSMAFVDHLLRQAALPVLILMTARDPMPGPLDALAERPSVECRLLAPLSRAHRSELVRRLLYLQGELASQVEQRTAGNPLFAVQLVGSWVARGVLEVGAKGFVLRSGESPQLPDDLHVVWTLRSRRLLEGYPAGEMRDAALATLEIAAVLGQDVLAVEWRLASEAAGVPPVPGLADLLLGCRLGVPRDGGWSFVHGMLRESLERGAAEAGRLPGHHAACAAMLAQRYPGRPPGVSGRLGRHLLEAGRLLEALEPLLQGARDCKASSDVHLALDLLGRYQGALDALAAPQVDPRRIAGWLLETDALGADWRLDAARESAERATRAARSLGDKGDLADALRLTANVTMLRGQAEDAEALSREAVALFEGQGEVIGGARARLDLACSMALRGRGDEAQAILRVGLERLEAAGAPELTAQLQAGAAFVALQRGDAGAMLGYLAPAREAFTACGQPHELANCLNSLGEAHRLRGELDQAEAYYRESAELWQRLAVLGSSLTPLFNLAMVHLERGQHLEARRTLEPMVAQAVAAGVQYSIPAMQAGLTASAAGEADWGTFDQRCAATAAALDKTDAIERDAAWALHRAADLALAADERERAHRAYQLASRLWRALDARAEIARIDAALL